MRKILKSKTLVKGIVLAFVFSSIPIILVAQEANYGNMNGYVYEKDGETPIKDAVVKIRNITTNQEFSSQLTNNSGEYKIGNIPVGIYHVKIYLDKNHQYNQRVMPEIVKGQTLTISFNIKKKTPFPIGLLKCPGTYLLALAGILVAFL